MEYIISLGFDCSAARYIRRIGKRKLAFPFDWAVTPIQSAIELFRTDFKDFLNENDLIFLPPTPRKLIDDNDIEIIVTRDLITPCISKKYNILLPHDFTKEGSKDLSMVKDKYHKRINRMYDLFKETDNNFIFVAHNDFPHEWQQERYKMANKTFTNDFGNWKIKLKQVIDSKFPTLKYEMYTLREFNMVRR